MQLGKRRSLACCCRSQRPCPRALGRPEPSSLPITERAHDHRLAFSCFPCLETMRSRPALANAIQSQGGDMRITFPDKVLTHRQRTAHVFGALAFSMAPTASGGRRRLRHRTTRNACAEFGSAVRRCHGQDLDPGNVGRAHPCGCQSELPHRGHHQRGIHEQTAIDSRKPLSPHGERQTWAACQSPCPEFPRNQHSRFPTGARDSTDPQDRSFQPHQAVREVCARQGDTIDPR